MKVSKTFYASSRQEWRTWLKENHSREKEIWLLFFLKDSGKPNISYNEAVEEAICFGWIDSIVKKTDHKTRAQRFTPRNPKSNWSELNMERARLMIKQKKMTKAGLAALGNVHEEGFQIPADILKALQKDREVWANFQKFPDSYKRIRIGFIKGSRNRKDFFKKRLNYFLKRTKENKMYGTKP